MKSESAVIDHKARIRVVQRYIQGVFRELEIWSLFGFWYRMVNRTFGYRFRIAGPTCLYPSVKPRMVVILVDMMYFQGSWFR